MNHRDELLAALAILFAALAFYVVLVIGWSISGCHAG